MLDYRGGHYRKEVLRGYALVGLGAAVLYGVTCAPGAVWQDSGMILYRVWHHDVAGRLGLALSHPLYYLLAIGAKTVLPGEFGFRVHLLTGLCSALAVANAYLLVRLWTGRVLPGLVAGLSLAVSHTFWRHGTIAETYNLFVALMLGELIVLWQYSRTRRVGYLYGLALLNGLALADHLLAVFGGLCYLVYVGGLAVKRRVRLRSVGVMGLLWAVGASPYLYLVGRMWWETGDGGATLASALFGTHYQDEVLNARISWRIVKENVMYIGLNFPTPNLLLAGVGLAGLRGVSRERWYGRIVLALGVLYLGFAFRYTVVDRYAFFIPFYALVAVWIGLGARRFLERRRNVDWAVLILLGAVIPVGMYIAAPEAARRMGVSLGTGREIPYRDEYNWFLRPWRTGYWGAERFAREALATAGPAGVIYADNTTVYPLLYVQEVREEGRSVRVVGGVYQDFSREISDRDGIIKMAEQGKLYVVTPRKGYCPKELLDWLDFKQAGVLYRAAPK